MKKHILLGLVVLLGVCCMPLYMSAYQMTDKDFELLDKIENKLYPIITAKNTITAERVVLAIDNLLHTHEFNERKVVFLEVLAGEIMIDFGLVDDEERYMLPEECYEDEYYNKEEQRCYPLDEDEDDESYFDNGYTTHGHDDREASEVVADFLIAGDDITLQGGTPEADMETNIHRVRDLFASLIPAEWRTDLTRLEIVNDAAGDEYAHVRQDEDDITQWIMQVNIATFFHEDGTFNPKESIHTLIHEYAHVLTLNQSQVSYIPELAEEDDIYTSDHVASCTTHVVVEGCLSSQAYLGSFIAAFRTKEQRMNADEEDLYTDQEDMFITEYASTNAGEDIAESFTAFVIKNKPKGTTIAEQKIRFFYRYPQLVRLRNIIRSRLKAGK